MLKDTFFTILERLPVENTLDVPQQFSAFTVVLDPSHPLYEGHFPGNPVVPGVCQIEMIRELLGICLDHEMRILNAISIKYLAMISPKENPQLRVDLNILEKTPGITQVIATITNNSLVFLKFKGLFIMESE